MEIIKFLLACGAALVSAVVILGSLSAFVILINTQELTKTINHQQYQIDTLYNAILFNRCPQ